MNFEPILYGPLFTRDAQDVNLVAASADPVDVAVSSSGLSWTVPVTPVLTGGRYLAPLRMREILASVALPLGLQDPGTVDVPMVTLSAGDASMSFRAIRGAAAGKTPAQLAGHWLSWRDQISKTYTWGRERLTFLAGLDLLGWRSGSYSVSAKVYFQDADPVTLSLASGTLQAGCQFVTVDASFAAISALVSGVPAAWDVSYAFSGTDSDGAAASIGGYPLRLVVARADVRVKEFVFCNGFGVEDRVYSSGRSNPKLEGASVAFLNGGEESELRNDAEEGREVYSGYLGTARESALWLDFLKAYDRRILLNGIPEKIVVDSQETDLQDNAIGSVKFTYHLACLDAGRYFQDAEGLGDFDPMQQYGALYVGDDPASEDLPVEDLFFLKTRLDEFPAADLTEELLFLVQNPLTQAWGNAPLSSIKEWLQEAITAYETPVWSGPWEDYRAGVADFALAAALGKNLDDRIRAIERSPFVLPVASDTVLGGIKVGGGLSIDGNGVLSVENSGFFRQSADLATLVELKPGYAYLGTRKGLVFDANAEEDGNADFEKVQLTIGGQTITALHSKLPFFSDSWISAGGISPGGGASAGNATLVAQTYGGTLSATGINPINFYSKERVDQLIATAGTVQTVAGVSPTSGDIPVASLKSALGLGAAAEYGIGSVASGSTGLVTGGSVYSAINEAVSSVLKMQGTTTTAISDGSTTNPVTINGSSYTAKKGDVVMYGNKEFWWTGSAWEELGDEASWALKTTTISAGTGLDGGGTLASNRSISLSAASIASLALADSAYQKPSTGIPQTDLASALSTKIDHGESAYTNLNDWFEIVDGNIHVKGNRGFYSDSWISAGGISPGGGASAGNATLVAQTYGGTLSATGIDPINFYSKERVDQLLATAGKVQTVAGVSPTNGNIPTADLQTALGFSNYYTKTQVDNLIGAIDQFHYEVYAALPAVGEGNVLYLIGPTGAGSDKYEEYVFANNSWTKIGDTSIDLSGYLLVSTAAATYATITALNGVSGRVTTLEGRTNWDTYFGVDENGDIYVKKNGDTARGFYSYGFVSAGGISSGGGAAGIDLAAMWASLTNNPADAYASTKIAVAHIPDLSGTYLPLSAGSSKPLTGDLYITGGNGRVVLSGVVQYNYSNTTNLLGPYAQDLSWYDGSDWRTVYHSGNLTKSVLTGLLDASGGYYLPLTGGVIRGNFGCLRIQTTDGSVWVGHELVNSSGQSVGYYAGRTDGSGPYWLGPSQSAAYAIWHSGNSNLSTVPWACSTLTASGNINVSGRLYFDTGDAFISRATNITNNSVTGEIGVFCNDGSSFQKFRIWCSTTEVTGDIATSGTLRSTVATGTAPLSVASTTLVTNLDADLLDGYHADELAKQYYEYSVSAESTYDGLLGGKLYGASNWPYSYYAFLSAGYGNYKMQFNAVGNELRFRAGDENGLSNKPWREVLFADSTTLSNMLSGYTRYYGNFTGTAPFNGLGYFAGSDGWWTFGPGIAFGIGNSYVQLQGDYYGTTLKVRTYVGSTSTMSDWKTIWTEANSNKSDVSWTCSNLTVGEPGSHGLIGCPYHTTDTNKYNYIDFYGGSSDGDIRYIAGTWTGGDHIAHRFLVANNVDALAIRNSGNVGIGTTSPAYKLEVNGPVSCEYVRIPSNTGSWNDAKNSEKFRTFCNYTDVPEGSPGTYMSGISFTTTYNAMQFAVYGGYGDDTLYFRKSGDTSPYWGSWRTIWHNGNSNLSTVPWTCSTLTASGDIHTDTRLTFSGMTIGWWDGSNNRIESESRPLLITSYAQPIMIGLNGDGNSIYVNTSGNIGLGTSSPSQKLHVEGGVYASSGYRTTTTDLLGLFKGSDITGGLTANDGALYYSGHTLAVWANSFNVYGNIEATGTIHSSTGIYTEGYVTAGATSSSSDERLKSGIKDFGYSAEMLMALRPREWDWNEKSYMKGHAAGVVAQELQQVMPYAIVERQYLSVNYDMLHAVEISGLQDHETRIRQLERENAELKRRLNMN